MEQVEVGRLRRVVVIGPYGAGKTWLAHELGLALQIPVHHLDALHWQGDWTLLPRSEWVSLLERLVAGEAWVSDDSPKKLVRRLPLAGGPATWMRTDIQVRDV